MDSTFKNAKSGHLAESDMISKSTSARKYMRVYNTLNVTQYKSAKSILFLSKAACFD